MSALKEQHLHAEQLRADPRIAEAKRLVLEALAEHQQNVTQRPADPACKVSYQALLDACNTARGGNLFLPFLGSGFGKGPLVELADGSVKYDMIAGIGPHYWGHCHPDLVASSFDAALSDTIMQGHLQQNVDSLEVMQLLTQASGIDHCFLTTSGAMACENALKICFQKRFPAKRVLAFEHCFMGRTLALAQVTDKAAYRQGLPATITVDYVPFYDPKRPEESTKAALNTLKECFKRYPNDYAVMAMELVQGEGGFSFAPREFYVSLMTLLKEHKVAILVDEIQSFGRLPSLFAFQHFGLESFVDVVTLGKLSQVCATLFRSEFKPQPGLLSQTFTASATALAAAKVMIGDLLHAGYLGPDGKISRIHKQFEDSLKAIERRHPGLVEGPYGIGGMVAFTAFKGDPAKIKTFIYKLFDAGVIAFTAGPTSNRIRFLVPMGAIEPAHIEPIMRIVETCLVEVERAST